MKNRLIVVTDLGCFKAYRVDDSPFNSNPRLELVEEFITVAGHKKVAELTTDQAGQFPKATGMQNIGGQMSNGERHNIELEQRRRLVKQLAANLKQVVERENPEVCYFAAGREINREILEELPKNIREKIEKNVPSDLTKVDKSDLLKHF